MKSVSILIPTLNAERLVAFCLESIAKQDYPSDLVEIIIADAGSTDRTLEIARRYTDKIYANALKTGEAGKAIALQHAGGEIVALIDSDNILPQMDWLRRMIEPFDDAEIVGTEPIEFTYRREDGYISRYAALMGMNDPLCLFLGNYDRRSVLTGKWTEMPVVTEDRGGFLKVTLDKARPPTIGANGFLVRRAALASCSVQDYFFDIDVVYELLLQGKSKFAKVKIGIIHIFSESVEIFIRKQVRRVEDYNFYSQSGLRKYPWTSISRARLAKFIIYCVVIFPLLVQSLRGFRKRRDRAWFFHPVICWITLLVYGYGTLRGLFIAKPASRMEWRQ